LFVCVSLDCVCVVCPIMAAAAKRVAISIFISLCSALSEPLRKCPRLGQHTGFTPRAPKLLAACGHMTA
jgi:hypothetical protein